MAWLLGWFLFSCLAGPLIGRGLSHRHCCGQE